MAAETIRKLIDASVDQEDLAKTIINHCLAITKMVCPRNGPLSPEARLTRNIEFAIANYFEIEPMNVNEVLKDSTFAEYFLEDLKD